MERFMITLTPNPTEQINAYQINGANCSFSNGTFTFVTSGEDVVNILGQPSYIMITPLEVSPHKCKYTVMVTLDDSKPPTVIFDGENSESCFEVFMDHKCEILFKEDDDTKCLTPEDIDEIVDKPDVKAEEPTPKADNIMKTEICDNNSNKLSIQKPVEADVESSDANITELTSYDKILNAIYEIFEENSPIPYDREIFNDICEDGIRTEASNWKLSMHPYIVTFHKESSPMYTNVLHIIIEKTKKLHNGYSSGMYLNRGTIKMLLIFNRNGDLTRFCINSAVVDPNNYLNQEIRDLFNAINNAKEKCDSKGYKFTEEIIDNEMLINDDTCHC